MARDPETENVDTRHYYMAATEVQDYMPYATYAYVSLQLCKYEPNIEEL